MKTYQDLSDEQLRQLAEIAVGDFEMKWGVDRKQKEFISVRSGFIEVTFWLEEGDIFHESHTAKGTNICYVFNLWQIVALCQSWGVDYSPKKS